MSKIQTWKAFTNHWILWRFCGIHPPKRDSVWFRPYIVYAVLLNITTTLLFPTTFVVKLILSETLTELCEYLYMASTDVLLNIKFINVFIIRHKLLSVSKILERLDARAKTLEEVAVLEEGIKSAKRCFVTFLRLCCCIIFTSQLIAYMASDRILMYPAWFPWNWKASRTSFLLTHSYQLYGLIVQTIQNLGNDTYPQAYLVVLAAHVKTLAMRIQKLGSNGPQNTDAKIYQELTDCIQDHKIIYELFLTIQENLSTTCLLQFIATGLAQCTIGVYMMYIGLDFTKLLNATVYFSAVTTEIFILCYFGDVYCQANDYLTEAIYACNWMDRDEKFKKALLLLLQRSQKSSIIMAGNLIPVTMPTFVRVMKTAYSFFTVLNKVN